MQFVPSTLQLLETYCSTTLDKLPFMWHLLASEEIAERA